MADVSIIAVVTGIIQAIGTVTVVVIQRNQIKGLRNSISDQKASIDALKAQADGQVSLNTEQRAVTSEQRALNDQMRQMMSSSLTESERRIIVVKETHELEKQAIESKLIQAQAEIQQQKQSQIERAEETGAQPEVIDLFKNVIELHSSTREDFVQLQARIDGLISAAQNSVNNTQQLSISPLELEIRLTRDPNEQRPTAILTEDEQLSSIARKVGNLRIRRAFEPIISKWVSDGGSCAAGLVMPAPGQEHYSELCKKHNFNLYNELSHHDIENALFNLAALATGKARLTTNDEVHSMNSKTRVYNGAYTQYLFNIYDSLNIPNPTNPEAAKQFIKLALENERAFLGQEPPIIINHFLMKLIHVYKTRTGQDLNYRTAEQYANTLGLGPFIGTA